MAGEFTISQANGLLKNVYGKLQQVMPEAALLQKEYPLGGNIVGDHFEEPVVVRMPQGHNFNGSAGAVLQMPRVQAGKTVPAQVYPSEYVLREQISYGLLDRAKNGGETAFVSAMELEGKMMALSARNVLEFETLWGQTGLATCGANIASHVITITASELAPGILALIEGMQVDIFPPGFASYRCQNAIVSAVDTDAGTLTLDGTVTDTSVVAGDVIAIAGTIVPGGTPVFYSQMGLFKQMAGANGTGSSGTVFNLDKAQYNLWRANVQTGVGEFTPSALVRAATKLQDKGFISGQIDAWLSPRAWGVLNSALMVGEVFQGGYSMKRKVGTDDIEINNAGVKIATRIHPYMKQGYAMLLPGEYCKRVGAIDLTFAKAGTTDEFLQPVQSYNAMERQARAQWQIFLERPSWATLLTGITFSS